MSTRLRRGPVETVRHAIRLGHEDPARLALAVRRRLGRASRGVAKATGWRGASAGSPAPAGADAANGRPLRTWLHLAVTLPSPAERGHFVLERLRGYEDQDYLARVRLRSGAGAQIRPGRGWTYAKVVQGQARYVPAGSSDTVTLPFTGVGSAVARIELSLLPWSDAVPEARAAFGRVLVVYQEERRTGAEPHRLAVAALAEEER